MSCNYADGLSPYHDKGQLGLEERFDNNALIAVKVDMLAKWINKAKHVVIHTGAGISTSAGIPDFRGPKGVWTLEAKGQKPTISTDFNEATPTHTHMAITRLVEASKVKYVVSQNIDGLHLRSGLPRKYLSELHGNMFIEQCSICNRQFVRNTAVPTVGQKSLGKACPTIKPNGRACRGRLHDTILDWEHSLPENDLAMADFHSCMADLSIALGTTMQIVPSGSLPLYTKKAGGKLIIINLQPTKHDTKADLLIHGYADEVMAMLMKQLSLRIPKYAPKNDPTRLTLSSDRYFEWTISDAATAQMRRVYEAKCGTKEARKRLEAIDDDDVPLITRVKANFTQATDKSHRKRKGDEASSPTKSKAKRDNDGDSDLEVVEEIPKRRGRPRKQTELPLPPTTKLTIKKNVTPTKTKYEIVPTRSEKRTKRSVEIVHENEASVVADLEMLCESDDDTPVCFTTNFRRYLHDDKTFKREDKPSVDGELTASTSADTPAPSSDVKEEDVKKEEDGSKKTAKEEEGGSLQTEKVPGTISDADKVPETNTDSEKVPEKASEGDKVPEKASEGDGVPEKAAEASAADATDGPSPDQEPKSLNEQGAAMDSVREECVVPEAGEGESGATPSLADSAASAEGAQEPQPDVAPPEAEVVAREAEGGNEAEVPERAGDGPVAPRSPLPGEMPADIGALPGQPEPSVNGEAQGEDMEVDNDGNNNSDPVRDEGEEAVAVGAVPSPAEIMDTTPSETVPCAVGSVDIVEPPTDPSVSQSSEESEETSRQIDPVTDIGEVTCTSKAGNSSEVGSESTPVEKSAESCSSSCSNEGSASTEVLVSTVDGELPSGKPPREGSGDDSENHLDLLCAAFRQ